MLIIHDCISIMTSYRCHALALILTKSTETIVRDEFLFSFIFNLLCLLRRFFTPSLSGRKTMTSLSRKIQLVVTPPDFDDGNIKTKSKMRKSEKGDSKIARKNGSYQLPQRKFYKCCTFKVKKKNPNSFIILIKFH